MLGGALRLERVGIKINKWFSWRGAIVLVVILIHDPRDEGGLLIYRSPISIYFTFSLQGQP
jgi:hypothetical protein